MRAETPTRVISVRGRRRDELEADPDFVYVGRAVRFTTWDRSSRWANPFSARKYGEEAVRLFEQDLRTRIAGNPALLADLRRELRGKTLGCWCGDWSPGEPEILCHGVVLARLADADGPGNLKESGSGT